MYSRCGDWVSYYLSSDNFDVALFVVKTIISKLMLNGTHVILFSFQYTFIYCNFFNMETYNYLSLLLLFIESRTYCSLFITTCRADGMACLTPVFLFYRLIFTVSRVVYR